MVALGVIILIVFLAFGAFLITKGVRQGDEVDQYNTSGKMYVGLGVFAVIFALGLSIFCFIKAAEFDSNDYSYSNSTNSGSYGSSSNSGNSGSSSSSSFTNKYGTRTTKCAVSGCSNYIAKSGDTNCCTTHSRRCGECYCYIDSDAMYCMSCLTSAVSGSSNSSSNKSNSSHECYVCGDKAYSKYGSYYYCSDCLALVKAFSN